VPDSPLISVIVPVYGVEPYLRRCLDSLCRQSLAELEIIVVNDASPDNCQAIIDEYTARDGRIVPLRHSQNRGLGAARNTGIELARGEYLAFVDSDDWVEPNTYRTLLRRARSHKAPLVVAGVRCVWPDPARLYEMSYEGLLQGGAPALRALATGVVNPVVAVAAWNKLYERSLFCDTGYRYATGILMEDWSVSIRLLATVDCVLFVPDLLHNYWQCDDSIMRRRWGRHHYYSYLKVIQDLDGFFTRQGLWATAGDTCAGILGLHNNWLYGGLKRLEQEELHSVLDDELVAEICRTPQFVRHLLSQATNSANHTAPAAAPESAPADTAETPTATVRLDGGARFVQDVGSVDRSEPHPRVIAHDYLVTVLRNIKQQTANSLHGTALFGPARSTYRVARSCTRSCRRLLRL
jgi:glycosyltransferase involved in cell wall biosynthesis